MHSRGTTGLVFSLGCVAVAPAIAATLSLVPSHSCYHTGDAVDVDVLYMQTAGTNICGGQFFLSYDGAALQLVGYVNPVTTPNAIVPGDAPLIAELHESVSTAAATIDYAVGLDPFTPPAYFSGTSIRIATIHFTAMAEICNAADLVSFRADAGSNVTRVSSTRANPNPPPALICDQSIDRGNTLLTTDLSAISIDDHAPIVTPPPDATVACDAVPTAPATVGASDSCDAAVTSASFTGESIVPLAARHVRNTTRSRARGRQPTPAATLAAVRRSSPCRTRSARRRRRGRSARVTTQWPTRTRPRWTRPRISPTPAMRAPRRACMSPRQWAVPRRS